MTSFSVCRVWGLFFAVLPLVMATSYAQDAGNVEKVDVLKPVAGLVAPDERIVIEGRIVAKRGTPEGAIVKGNIKVGYWVLVPIIHPDTGETHNGEHFVVVDEVAVSGVVKKPRLNQLPHADFRVGLNAPAAFGWRVGEIYEVVGTPVGTVGSFVVFSPPGLPGSGEGGPNTKL